MSVMLEQMRVLITAGASGIGATIARTFAADGALVDVADIDGTAVETLTSSDEHIRGRICDVSDPQAVDGWIDAALSRWHGVDVLVNNAGIAGPTNYVEDIEVEQWRRCVAITLESQFLTCRRVAPVMKSQGSGSIINISSTAGLVGYGLRTPYASAKWAVIGLTKSLAIELGAYGVRVNAICPGSVEGPRMQGVIESEAVLRGVSSADIAAAYTGGQSISRFVRPEEIADLCRFLASPAAAMISGQAIAVDGHTETFHISST
jgi:NAD(P)-dependent dehydrogenase (short-subunit alcohol dehydrogenase family)